MAEPRAEQPYMPDYGIDTPGWSPLPWAWAAERLVRSQNLWLVTVSGDGRPHAMPVWGVWDDGVPGFAFSCGPHARKARNLAADPRAVVMADSTSECVSVEGRASALENGDRKERWIERYLAKYQPAWPDTNADFLRRNAMFELFPERAFAVIERPDEFSTRMTRWTF